MGHMHGNVSDSMLISWENPVPEGVEKMPDFSIDLVGACISL